MNCPYLEHKTVGDTCKVTGRVCLGYIKDPASCYVYQQAIKAEEKMADPEWQPR